ncbi:Peroxidase 2 [Ceratobasidium theobromae]|uniref:Peroxidase 2 n=1 Tax=Ceratobasidium theobromae TaxID=1582974 RepID=A0A5N5QK58_9AGAM|nr:Peroxidase 2 [Ceratobasidium theobromae]
MEQPSPDKVNTDNVQGDIIFGFPKRKEEFVFFVIKNAKNFKLALADLNVTSTTEVIEARKNIEEAKAQGLCGLIPCNFLNIAFSQKGLNTLGISDKMQDDAFTDGQLANAEGLGDDGIKESGGFEPNWETAFKHPIDGVLLVAGESWNSVNNRVKDALLFLGDSVLVAYRLKGSTRPGDQKGHEHFGWNDGISNPAIDGLVKPYAGQTVVEPGVILCRKPGDNVADRPEWTTEGSFLVFRQLEQLVPEFHKFLADNPVVLDGLDRERGSELQGARLFGRWKSGASLIQSPTKDDSTLGKDPKRNNDFQFPQNPGDAGQALCPYAAHIRKTNPRNDLEPDDVKPHSVNRTGIAYGPEVQPGEHEEHVSEFSRGLAFVCYQSSIDKGFQFMQKSWANNQRFPPFKTKKVVAGFDPIIGQANGLPRETLGSSEGPRMTLPIDFVISRGGEYFFSPSIDALRHHFAGVPRRPE